MTSRRNHQPLRSSPPSQCKGLNHTATEQVGLSLTPTLPPLQYQEFHPCLPKEPFPHKVTCKIPELMGLRQIDKLINYKTETRSETRAGVKPKQSLEENTRNTLSHRLLWTWHLAHLSLILTKIPQVDMVTSRTQWGRGKAKFQRNNVIAWVSEILNSRNGIKILTLP